MSDDVRVLGMWSDFHINMGVMITMRFSIPWLLMTFSMGCMCRGDHHKNRILTKFCLSHNFSNGLHKRLKATVRMGSNDDPEMGTSISELWATHFLSKHIR